MKVLKLQGKINFSDIILSCNTVVFDFGVPGDKFYIILKCKVWVFKPTEVKV